MFCLSPLFLLLALLLSPSPCVANDSVAAFAGGGLKLLKSDDLRMKSEQLTLSPHKVLVDYVFANDMDHDIATEVAFPIAALSVFQAGGAFDDFTVTVNAVKKTYETSATAQLNGQDISAALKELGLPPDRFVPFEDLPPATQKEVEKRRFYTAENMDEAMAPAFTLSRTYHWKQVFPAHKETRIQHSYTPFLGETSMGALNAQEEWKSLFRAPKEENAYGLFPGYFARTLEYILSTGSNWKNGIEDFSLTVEGANVIFLKLEGRPYVALNRLSIKRQHFYPQKEILVEFLASQNLAAPPDMVIEKRTKTQMPCRAEPSGPPLLSLPAGATVVLKERGSGSYRELYKVKANDRLCWVEEEGLEDVAP